MKLFVILLAINLQLSAAVFSQQIDITVKNAPLREVLQSIKKQSGYNFLAESLKDAKSVTITLHLKSVEDALEKIFAEQPYTYSIAGKMIIIQPKKSKKKDENIQSPLIDEKPILIKGRVTDPENKPLPGVSIHIKGSNKGTTTDKDGNYSISAEPSGTLIFSSVGFLTAEVKINERQFIELKMQEYKSQLEEQVIKGYYSTTKAFNTGNVSTVRSSDIAKQPISDPLSALQGKIPGLFIQQNSGATGRAFKVQLRGRNSIANGNDPLYIVDGIPFNSTPLNTTVFQGGAGQPTSPLNDLSPADIESIDVLKDADATAIYGSRGANGVILITTKKGRVGKPELNVNYYAGAGKVSRRLDLMNTEEYIEMRKKAFANDNANPTDADYDLNGVFDENKYTDWQKKLIGGTAAVHDLQTSLSGGNTNSQFRIGMGYRNEGTVYPGEKNSQKGNVLVNLHHRSDNNKLLIDFTGNYVSSENNLPAADMTSFITLAPNSPEVYDAKGNLNWQNSTFNNPYTNILQKNIEKTSNLIGNFQLSYSINNWLQFKVNTGYNKVELIQSVLTPFAAYDPAFAASAPELRSNQRNTNRISNWIIEPQLSYNHNLWIGNLEALVGTTFQQTRGEGLVEATYGYTSDALIGNLAAGSMAYIVENKISQYRYNAVYARLGYNIDEKYILNVTGRRDGSSRFGPGKQFGNFGSIGAAWIFTNESWFRKSLKALSFGKIRGSIGSTGNDKLEDYQYLSTYSSYSSSYQGVSGLTPTQLTNPFYGWERVNKIELALDLGFIDDRILISTSIYRNRTDNQLVGYSLPNVAGFATVQANLPAVIENKGLEVEINTINVKRKNFSWSSSANINFPRNKLVSYPNLKSSTYATLYVIGQPLFISNKYNYTGIDAETGLYTFEDRDKDGSITSRGDRVPVFVGQKYYGGFNNTFSFKSIQLDILLTYCKQTGIDLVYNGQPGVFASGAGNQPRSVIGNKDIQPYTQDFTNPIFTQNSLFLASNGVVGDASYIRLKNLALSYTLPNRLVKKANFLRKGRIYVQCQNLFTITGYRGLDPETQLGTGYNLPTLRTITAGFQLTL